MEHRTAQGPLYSCVHQEEAAVPLPGPAPFLRLGSLKLAVESHTHSHVLSPKGLLSSCLLQPQGLEGEAG